MDNVETGKTESTKKAKRDLGLIISVLSLLIAAISIALQFYFIRGNQLAKANAGNVKAQLFLADHYYEIGDTDESIYWYKLASADNGKKGAYAKNNLAVLYIQTGMEEKGGEYLCGRIVTFFEQAADKGCVEAAQNLYAYIKLSPDSLLINSVDDVDGKLEKAKAFLEKKKAFTAELAELDAEWEYVSTETGVAVPRNTDEYYFETVSSDTIYESDPPSFRTIHTYKVYKRKTVAGEYEYKYVHYK